MSRLGEFMAIHPQSSTRSRETPHSAPPVFLALRFPRKIFPIYWIATASTKAVLSPPALSRPWKAIVCDPAVTVNTEVE
jgi:hypothetical protein